MGRFEVGHDGGDDSLKLPTRAVSHVAHGRGENGPRPGMVTSRNNPTTSRREQATPRADEGTKRRSRAHSGS